MNYLQAWRKSLGFWRSENLQFSCHGRPTIPPAIEHLHHYNCTLWRSTWIFQHVRESRQPYHEKHRVVPPLLIFGKIISFFCSGALFSNKAWKHQNLLGRRLHDNCQATPSSALTHTSLLSTQFLWKPFSPLLVYKNHSYGLQKRCAAISPKQKNLLYPTCRNRLSLDFIAKGFPDSNHSRDRLYPTYFRLTTGLQYFIPTCAITGGRLSIRVGHWLFTLFGEPWDLEIARLLLHENLSLKSRTHIRLAQTLRSQYLPSTWSSSEMAAWCIKPTLFTYP